MSLFDPDNSAAETAAAMDNPQPGDRFTEMYAFFMYVLAREGQTITVMEAHPPCVLPEGGFVLTMSLTAFRKRYGYENAPGYYIRLCDRGHAVAGWAEAGQRGRDEN